MTCFVEPCQEPRLSDSPFCPTHGLPEVASRRWQRSAPPTRQLTLQALLIGFVAVVSLMVAVGGMDGSASASNYRSAADFEDSGHETTAKATCRNVINERLQTASSAEYSDEIVTAADPTYVVVGNVTVNRSAGAAMSRTAAFRCTVRQDGEDDWQLVSLQGLGE